MKPPCKENCKLKCSSKITEEERQNIFSDYWNLGTIERQRCFISNSMQIVQPKYRYIREGGTRNKRRNNNAFTYQEIKSECASYSSRIHWILMTGSYEQYWKNKGRLPILYLKKKREGNMGITEGWTRPSRKELENTYVQYQRYVDIIHEKKHVEVELKKAYEHKPGISEKKKADLLELLEKKLIPKYYEPFYNAL